MQPKVTLLYLVTSCCFLALRFKCLKRLKVLGQLLTALESGKIHACKKSSAEGKNGPSSSNEHHPRMLPYMYIYIRIYVHIYIHVGKPDVTSSCTISLWSS